MKGIHGALALVLLCSYIIPPCAGLVLLELTASPLAFCCCYSSGQEAHQFTRSFPSLAVQVPLHSWYASPLNPVSAEAAPYKAPRYLPFSELRTHTMGVERALFVLFGTSMLTEWHPLGGRNKYAHLPGLGLHNSVLAS
eukprot:1160803-Pelagomonas_calceolata.AAC.14